VGLAVLGLMGCGTAGADSLSATVADQKDLQVTVYNQQLGLVKDTRIIKLPEGDGELRFMDVAQQIRPETVRIRSLNNPSKLSILEQNYEYDLISPDKLLEKYIGKDIDILTDNEYQDRKEQVTATLLSNDGEKVYQINDHIWIGHPGYHILPEIPEDLITKPTLMWQYVNQSSTAHEIEASYLTNGFSWKADYILLIGENDAAGELSGWVTIDNQTGTAYRNAKLKLVAGDVNQAPSYERAPKVYAMRAMAADVGGAEQFNEQQLFEYHSYDLKRRTTLKNNQTKQISFLSTTPIKIQKEYSTRGENYLFMQGMVGNEQSQPVNVMIRFENSKSAGLGLPLPAGVIRMYKEDSEGSTQFVGEDRIQHTPKDDSLKLNVGKAFDVNFKRKQTAFQQITTRLNESEWEITIKNAKDTAVTVFADESLGHNWKILNSSLPYKKQDAFNVRFEVPVPANSSVTLKYKVQTGF
jgi:hypothetical protein